MEGGDVLITVTIADQFAFQPLHQGCHGKIQIDGPGGIKGDPEILAMQAEAEAQGISTLEHGVTAVFEGPGACCTVLECLDHAWHRKIQPLAQRHRLSNGGVAAGHQHLIHRLHLLSPSHGAEVVDGRSDDLEDGPNPLQWLCGSPDQHSEVRLPRLAPSVPPVTGASR